MTDLGWNTQGLQITVLSIEDWAILQDTEPGYNMQMVGMMWSLWIDVLMRSVLSALRKRTHSIFLELSWPHVVAVTVQVSIFPISLPCLRLQCTLLLGEAASLLQLPATPARGPAAPACA